MRTARRTFFYAFSARFVCTGIGVELVVFRRYGALCRQTVFRVAFCGGGGRIGRPCRSGGRTVRGGGGKDGGRKTVRIRRCPPLYPKGIRNRRNLSAHLRDNSKTRGGIRRNDESVWTKPFLIRRAPSIGRRKCVGRLAGREFLSARRLFRFAGSDSCAFRPPWRNGRWGRTPCDMGSAFCLPVLRCRADGASAVSANP